MAGAPEEPVEQEGLIALATSVSEAPVIFVCGIGKGTKADFRCPCCGVEANDPEAFATTACWQCAFGVNLNCKRCRETGVPIDAFDSEKGKLHRFARWTPGGHYAVSACGVRIQRKNIGQATAVREACQKCWPDGRFC